jgi:general secretion pathway protein L
MSPAVPSVPAANAPRAPSGAAPGLWHLGQGVPPAGRFVALVPGEGAPLLPVSLPPALGGAARLAVARRQVHDRLGPAAAQLDLRPAPLGSPAQGWGAVLAADPADLARWRAALGPAQSRALALIPDYLTLPQAPGLWVLAVAPDGRILARLGPADGFAAEAALAAMMLSRHRARGPDPRAVLVQDGPLPDVVAQALSGLPMADDPARLPQGLPRPERLALGETALDLRSDPGTRAAVLAARLRALVLPGALVAVGVAGLAVTLAREAGALRARAADMQAQTLDAVRRDFLPQGPIVDIPLQVDRALEQRRAAAQGSAPASALDVLHRAALGLADSGVIPQSLSVSRSGEGAADLLLPDFAALDRAVSALGAQGLVVGVARSATLADGQVGAGLTLTLSPSGAP